MTAKVKGVFATPRRTAGWIWLSFPHDVTEYGCPTGPLCPKPPPPSCRCRRRRCCRAAANSAAVLLSPPSCRHRNCRHVFASAAEALPPPPPLRCRQAAAATAVAFVFIVVLVAVIVAVSCNKGGSMGIGRRPTDDKAEMVSRVICLRFKFNFMSCNFA
jgi:hypothetical protein